MKTFISICGWRGRKAELLVWGMGLWAAVAVQAQPLLITTVAGYAGKGSTDGTGSGALFYNPQGVAVDNSGTVYVADTGNNTIRIINASGTSSTLAGRPGVSGSSDGTGTNAFFNQPSGIVLDNPANVGNIYVTDYGSSTIRKVVKSTGQVVTIAGTAGVAGSVNNTGTNSLFNHPLGIGVDLSTNLYVADYGNNLIRKMTLSGGVWTTATLAGSAGVFGSANGTGTAAQFYEPEGVAVDQASNVYVADTGNAVIRMITPGGVVTTMAGWPGSLGSTDATGTNALFYQPSGIAISSTGNIYVVDYMNNTVREITPGWVVTTEAGMAGTAGSVDGTNSAARFWGPQGVAVGSTGTIYIADTANSTIRTMTTGGVVSTLAGSASDGSVNGLTWSTRFYSPQNVAVDNASNLYVADTLNSVIRKITRLSTVSILAGTAGVFGSAEGTGPGAQFSGPQGVAVDSSGNVYVADTGNSTIRKLTPGGTSSTLAGLAGDPGNADGTGTSAQFNHPEGVAVDSSGNVYVADTWNHTIRKLTSGGASSTLAGMAGTFGSDNGTNSAARFNDPTGVAVDGSGNVYVTDYNNNTIREVTPAGVVTTLAGSAGMWGSSDGTNGNALFFQPTAISVNSAGTTLYVVDSGNNTLRKIVSSNGSWVVSTVAGLTGVIGSSDGTGTAAEFYNPQGVAVDNGGNVYVADTGNNTIRSQAISPTIITEPQSQTNQTGTPVTFLVTAFGSMPLSYIWQSNSITLAPSSSSSLTTIAAGPYQVTVSNVAGIMLSTLATLTLTNSTVGTNGVFNRVTVLNNGTVKFSLSGTSGSTYSLDVSTNLITWSTLTTFVMTNGSVIYTDVAAPSFPTRFYRLVSP